MPINGVAFAAIEKLQGANNYHSWISSLRTALQGESYEMWDLAIDELITEELVAIPLPSPEQAFLDACQYFMCEIATLAQVRQYIQEQVVTPNRVVMAEARRIHQLKCTATFYIRASVLPSALWVIQNEYDPHRCLKALSQQFSGMRWEDFISKFNVYLLVMTIGNHLANFTSWL